MKPELTVGLATYDDYEGLFFTIQSIRMHHKKDVEFVVIDNSPDSKHGELTKKFIQNDVKGVYVDYRSVNSTFTKYKALEYATSDYYLGLDSHVLLNSGFINNLLSYFSANPDTNDLIQGPLIYDDLKSISTHFKPGWSGGMYGTWETDNTILENGVPVEIPMNGMGMFACRTKSFPKINQNFRGFGGEEWYIQEKFRQQGGKCISIPQLQWMHRFNRPNGIPYVNSWEDRIRNYYIAWWELYPDVNHPMILSIEEHFKQYLSMEKIDQIFEEVINLPNEI